MSYVAWWPAFDDELAMHEIAEANLEVARGLPGSEGMVASECLRRLDAWSGQVEATTAEYAPQFRRSPAQFSNSVAQFRMLCLVTVLQRDLGVRYDSEVIAGDFDASRSTRLFINGPLSGHGGTCVNLPVLYIAVGRRLGYPLKLVSTFQHRFVRWVGADGERFNVEATSLGFNAPDDAYYRSWPRAVSESDCAARGFLVNMTPRQELASFLHDRGRCHLDNLQFSEMSRHFHYAQQMDDRYRGDKLVGVLIGRIIASIGPPSLTSAAHWNLELDRAAPKARDAEEA